MKWTKKDTIETIVSIIVSSVAAAVTIIKWVVDDIKADPVTNLIVPVVTTVVVYVALQLLPLILR